MQVHALEGELFVTLGGFQMMIDVAGTLSLNGCMKCSITLNELLMQLINFKRSDLVDCQ